MQKASGAAWSAKPWKSACELLHTRKAFHTMACNRLNVICHEDLDTLAAPHVFAVRRGIASPHPRERYADKKIGEARLMIGNAIGHHVPRAKVPRRMPFRCGHRAAVSYLKGYVPEMPDFALDQHTLEGRKLGRGLDHFRQEGALLVPPPTG